MPVICHVCFCALEVKIKHNLKLKKIRSLFYVLFEQISCFTLYAGMHPWNIFVLTAPASTCQEEKLTRSATRANLLSETAVSRPEEIHQEVIWSETTSHYPRTKTENAVLQVRSKSIMQKPLPTILQIPCRFWINWMNCCEMLIGLHEPKLAIKTLNVPAISVPHYFFHIYWDETQKDHDTCIPLRSPMGSSSRRSAATPSRGSSATDVGIQVSSLTFENNILSR